MSGGGRYAEAVSQDELLKRSHEQGAASAGGIKHDRRRGGPLGEGELGEETGDRGGRVERAGSLGGSG